MLLVLFGRVGAEREVAHAPGGVLEHAKLFEIIEVGINNGKLLTLFLVDAALLLLLLDGEL